MTPMEACEQDVLLDRINENAGKLVDFVYFFHPYSKDGVTLGSVYLEKLGVELVFYWEDAHGNKQSGDAFLTYDELELALAEDPEGSKR